MSNSTKIGRLHGAGLLATTLLGTSVFILPQMTIAIAGQGAIIAWLILTIAILPVALVFARLAALFPHAAGPAYFVEKAFGAVAGRTIGLIFLLVVPLGAPAALLMTYQFIGALIHLSPTNQLFTQLGLLAVIFALNYRGIQVSAKLQFALTIAIVTVVILLFSANGMQSTTPAIILPTAGVSHHLILAAAGLAFWSFLGVEAMAHLANDFEDPQKDLTPAMMIGTVIVGLIYLACTVLLLIVPTQSNVGMVEIFDKLLGGYGAQVIGILGIAGGLATVNVYTASVARLAWSFSQDGVLPRYFSTHNRYGVPERALTTLLLIMAVVLIMTSLSGKDLADLIAWSNGVFVIIYLASMFAAIKLLDKSNWPLIVLGCVFCVMLIWGLGWQMMYAILLLMITSPLLWWQRHHQQMKKVSVSL
ncbi:L-methionine/branched-chain amino acid transporter [Colwelliaceae bacterium 6471]